MACHRLLSSVACAATLLALVLLRTGIGAQRPTPDALAEAFAHAWNAHDPAAFRELYSDDADWVTVAGVRHRGGDAIAAALIKEHTTWARSTTLRATDVAVRVITPDHSIVIFSWEISSAVEGAAPPRRGSTLMVAARHARGWVVIAGQVASAPGLK